MRVGVFDSGIGGVNVLKSLINKYPNHEYIYFGDTKNLPYGNKDKETLLYLASNAIDFLIEKNVQIIIIACGTISSNCYRELKEKYSIPIYDVILPTINYLKNSSLHQIGVIGTIKTIESKIFDIENKKVIAKAVPSFVPIIENAQIEERKEEIKKELSCFKECDILVLGCTHYPLLDDLIKKEMHLKTLNMGDCLANTIKLTDETFKSCELYFSSMSYNLVLNVEKILQGDYQIYIK